MTRWNCNICGRFVSEEDYNDQHDTPEDSICHVACLNKECNEQTDEEFCRQVDDAVKKAWIIISCTACEMKNSEQ